MKFISLDAKERKCPSCGALMLIDDAQQTVHHEAPACRRWEQAMAATGGKRSVTIVPPKGDA